MQSRAGRDVGKSETRSYQASSRESTSRLASIWYLQEGERKELASCAEEFRESGIVARTNRDVGTDVVNTTVEGSN